MRFIEFLHGLRGHAAELKTRFASVRGQLLTRLNTAPKVVLPCGGH